jgi:catechol 2,3-dioxygenase-like lactoylglutathione lyase family enzyme
MLRVDHVVFPAWDAQRTLAFYRDIMGFPLARAMSGPDWGGFPWLMMFFSAGDNREIVLVALRGAKKPPADGLARDVRHLAFAEKAVSGLAKWRKKLEAAKIEFWEEKHGRQHSLYFEDPNGVILEVTAPPSSGGKTTRRAAVTMAERWIEGRG